MSKYYASQGQSVIRIPISKNERANAARRGVIKLDGKTTSEVISTVGLTPHASAVFLGKYNKAIPVLYELTKRTDKDCCLICSKRDVTEELAFADAEFEFCWSLSNTPSTLPPGNGIITVDGAESLFELTQSLPNYNSHYLMLCIGNGIQLNPTAMNALNGIGEYVVLTQNLSRGVGSLDGDKLTQEELMSAVDYTVISSIGASAKAFLDIVRKYECEKTTNTTDFSLHRNSPLGMLRFPRRMRGHGLRFSQSRTLEPKPIFSQEELTKIADDGKILIYCTESGHAYVADIIR